GLSESSRDLSSPPLSFVPSLCSTGAIIPSSRPALRSRRRAGAVKVGRRTPTLRHAPPLPPHLDSFEPDGPLGAVGMAIRGELAFGRGSIAPQPCIRWARGPEPGQPPVLTSCNRMSTLLQRFACARLSQSYPAEI